MKVIAVAAVSADGFIGQDESHLSVDWTSKEDRQFFVEITKKIGVVIMGRTTFDTIDRALPGRRIIVVTSAPDVHAHRAVTGVVEFTSLSPSELLGKLQSEGVSQVVLAGGARVWAEWMRAGLVDELMVTQESVKLGSGIPLFLGTPPTMELIDERALGPTSTLKHYRIIR